MKLKASIFLFIIFVLTLGSLSAYGANELPEELITAANNGDPEAQFALGSKYFALGSRYIKGEDVQKKLHHSRNLVFKGR